MSDIVLVTPPDKVYYDQPIFLLIYPSKIIKTEFQDIIGSFNQPATVYLYEQIEEDHYPEWLLDVFQQADYVILDIDNCPSLIRSMVSYFVGKNKTYWLTNGSDNLYNVISKNRVYSLDFLSKLIGGTFETE